MKKTIILTALTVCLTLNAKTILANCITHASNVFINGGGECNVLENGFESDTWYASSSNYLYLRAWGIITEGGPYSNNNVTLTAQYPSTNPSPWPTYITGYWSVVITNMDFPSDLQSGGDEVVTNQYDYYRTPGDITLTASSSYTASGYDARRLCRGGILATW